MRPIGNLYDETQARVFGDFLVVKGIKNEIEPGSDGSSLVWILDDDHLADAQGWLEKFRANPGAPEFLSATSDAGRARKAEAQKLAEYRQRIRTRRSVFPKFGGYGVGILTYLLIVICAIVAVYSKLGENLDLLRHLFISEHLRSEALLPEVFKQGEVWRLLAPIFIHFGPLHFLFNMMWLYQLGCMIEARRSSWLLALLVVVTGVCSNVAQYLASGPMGGGMSGVIYALAGFVWMRGKYDHASGLYLDPQSVTILLVWLVVCYTGVVGNIGNTAHLTGLITGMLWGRISAWFATHKPE